MLHAHLHLHDAVCKRTIRRSLSNFQTNYVLPEIGRTGKKTTFFSFGQKYEDEYEKFVEFMRSTNSQIFSSSRKAYEKRKRVRSLGTIRIKQR
jgi:uncharacterized protein YpuA (DUF1002 family)